MEKYHQVCLTHCWLPKQQLLSYPYRILPVLAKYFANFTVLSTINKSYHGDSDEELQILWLANDFPHPILGVPEIASKTSQLQPRTRSVTDFLQL